MQNELISLFQTQVCKINWAKINENFLFCFTNKINKVIKYLTVLLTNAVKDND